MSKVRRCPCVPSLPTRDGNLFDLVDLGNHARVPSLPTRDGNSGSPGGEASRGCEFPAYLQGMETSLCSSGVDGSGCSQPTYKGWKLLVLRIVGPKLERSQPTYKGWKQSKDAGDDQEGHGFPAYLQGMETSRSVEEYLLRRVVPSLPTRDGNDKSRVVITRLNVFPAYLQGMETRRAEKLEATVIDVPSLPTRDGNVATRTFPSGHR